MHLLQPEQFEHDEDTLELKIAEIEDFSISIDRRGVLNLQDRYEARNTRILIDVNTGEDDLVQMAQSKTDKGYKIRKKCEHVKQTITLLTQRKIEANMKHEFLLAPKRENSEKQDDNQKNKNVSNFRL